MNILEWNSTKCWEKSKWNTHREKCMHRIPYQIERFWKVLDGNLESRQKWECPDISVLHQNVDVPTKSYSKMNNSETFPMKLAENLRKIKMKYSLPRLYTPARLLNWSIISRFWCKFWERRIRKCLEIWVPQQDVDVPTKLYSKMNNLETLWNGIGQRVEKKTKRNIRDQKLIHQIP